MVENIIKLKWLKFLEISRGASYILTHLPLLPQKTPNKKNSNLLPLQNLPSYILHLQ